jgi:hypothetical protein
MRRRFFGSAMLALVSGRAPAPAADAPAPSQPSASAEARQPAALDFSIRVGGVDNHFYRRGAIAAHVLLAAERVPRFIAALPAGDTGAALWFDPLAPGTQVRLEGGLSPVERPMGMRGVTAMVRIGARSLRVRDAVLGSIRAIRVRAAGHPLPAGFGVHLVAGPPVVITRTMLDGHHVRLELAAARGSSLAVDDSGRISARAAGSEGFITLRLTALTDEAALVPIPTASLLRADAAPDPQSRDALAFLSTQEKLLAGSWTFLTYFGRDTLVSLEMLMPVLGAAPIEAGLGAVLDRVGAEGAVAHEELVGEWAVVEGRALEYSMIDEDFLLAPTLCRYLLDTPLGRTRARRFMLHRTPAGATYQEVVRRNLDHVLALAAPFAASRDPTKLVALPAGARAGTWRDSNEGLGGGRIPYDVNAALVPAALEAAVRLYASPLLGRSLEAAARARAYRDAWRSVAALFRVEIPAAVARSRASAHAAQLGLDAGPAAEAIHGPITFDALALDAAGRTVPVLHTDFAFRWMYEEPPPDEVERQARALATPFPAGLMTPLGPVVANAALSGDEALAAHLSRHAYHGTVVWSWQEALLAAGIRRQLARWDLTADARRALRDAERVLWRAIDAARALGVGTAELWSFTVREGKIEFLPFGEGGGDASESNPVQLWSTVYLAVRPSWELR